MAIPSSISAELDLTGSLPEYATAFEVAGESALPTAALVEMGLALLRHESLPLQLDCLRLDSLACTPRDRLVKVTLEHAENTCRVLAMGHAAVGPEAPRLLIRAEGGGGTFSEPTPVSGPSPTPGAARQSFDRLAPSKVYAEAGTRDIHVGTALQALQEAWIEQEQALARIELPASRDGGGAGYVLHPVALEAAFMLAAAFGGYVQEACGDDPPLRGRVLPIPAFIECMQVYVPGAVPTACRVTLDRAVSLGVMHLRVELLDGAACIAECRGVELATELDIPQLVASRPVVTMQTSQGDATGIEQLLGTAIEGALGKRVPDDADLFAWGVTSLVLLEVMATVERAVGVSVELEAVLDGLSIQGMSRLWRERLATRVPTAPLAPPLQAELATTLTSAQRGVWLADRLGCHSSVYNESVVLQFSSAVDVGAMQVALADVLRRYPALSSYFPATPDGPVRRVGDPVLLEVMDAPSPRADVDGQAYLDDFHRAPFDLETCVPMRAGLFRKADGDVLMVVCHHVLCDARSVQLLLQALASSYALALGCHIPVAITTKGAPVPATHDVYVPHRRVQTHLDWWLTQFEEMTQTTTPLPDPRRMRQAQASAARLALRWSAEAQARLFRLANETATTPFVAICSLLGLWLARWSRQGAVWIGTPVTTRVQAAEQDAVGCFSDLLPVRVDVAKSASFRALLRTTGTFMREALKHRHVSFADLLQHLSHQRASDVAPMFQTLVTLNPALQVPRFGDCTAERLRLNSRPALFDLTFRLEIGPQDSFGDVLEGDLEYRTDVFSHEEAEGLVSQLDVLLQSVVNAADAPLCSHAMVSPNEAARVHAIARAQVAADVPWPSLDAVFQQAARCYPDHTAVTEGSQHMTYAELDALSSRVAATLQRRGHGSGDVVAIALERSTSFLVVMLGVLRAGCVYLPLHPRDASSRMVTCLMAADACLLVASESLCGDLEASWRERTGSDAVSCMPICTVTGDEAGFAPVAIEGSSGAYVLYTSGSTGTPKGVRISHRSVVRFLTASREDFAFSEHDVWAHWCAPTFDVAVWEVWQAWFHGGRLVVVPPDVAQEPDTMARLIRDEGVTVWTQTPSAFRLLADAVLRENMVLPSLAYVVLGGERLEVEGLRAWWTRFGWQRPQVVNGYGITETTVFSTFDFLDAPALRTPAVSVIGRSIQDQDVYVLGPELELLPLGAIGEICIGGEGLAAGYVGDEELTERKFVSHPFASPGERIYRSGDLGRYLPDGNLQYLGRDDQQIKMRGFRIELGEIACAVERHPQIGQAVALREGEGERARLVVYCVACHGDPPMADAVRQFVSGYLPSYMVPSGVVFVDAIPLGRSGKVDTRALRAQAPVARVSTVYERPNMPSDGERSLLALWRDLLASPTLAVTDDFFAAGGNSLLLVRLANHMRARYGVPIPLDALYSRPTVRQAACLVAGLEAQPPPTIHSSAPGGEGPYVLLRRGVAPGVLLLPPIEGSVAAYRHLVAAWEGPEQMVGLEGSVGPSTIEALAEAYLSVLPEEGADVLVGASFGAVVAYAMAVALAKRGRAAKLLCLLDPPEPHGMRMLGAGLAGWEPGSVERREQVSHNALLLSEYSAPIYGGATRIFLAEEGRTRFETRWSERAPGAQVERIAGNHFSMLEAPHAAALAALLQGYVRVLAKPGTHMSAQRSGRATPWD